MGNNLILFHMETYEEHIKFITLHSD